MSSIQRSNDQTDGNVIVAGVQLLKSLDANRYATKKTIAQGLLDVALLTANASQLKYILQVGNKHEFYTLMLSLIIVSIVLQLIVAILFVIIGGLNINKTRDHTAAIVLNDVILIFVFLVSAALLSVIMAIMKMHHDANQSTIAEILNHVALGFVTGALFCDVIKMNFGLDPAVATVQAVLCIILGTKLNINKETDQDHADKANNFVLALNVVILIINIIIDAFRITFDDQITNSI